MAMIRKSGLCYIQLITKGEKDRIFEIDCRDDENMHAVDVMQ
jgi:hypothetical protein